MTTVIEKKKVGVLQVHLRKLNNVFLKSLCCHKYDIIVIGGGIIGTAIAKTIKENINEAKVALIEKEHDFGQHQSSHNSHVVHAGLYYRPNSLKAKFCVEGAKLIYDYCNTKNIPLKKYGKLIIASNVLENYRLKVLHQRGLENNVCGLKLIDNWKEVVKIQPNCRGLNALWSPNSGNINWEEVTKSFGNDFKLAGGDTFFNCEIECINESAEATYPLVLRGKSKNVEFLAKYAITCLGLYSGSLLDPIRDDSYKNISLNVNYHILNPRLNRFIKTNIYAMPHIDMPFIGIHFSPTVDGSVLLGPTAVPALKLDGYEKNVADLNYIQNNVLSQNVGLLFLKNFQSCLNQVRETVFGDFRTALLNKYVPMVSKNDILPGPRAVQGQIVTSDGEFVDDFLFEIFEGDGIQKRIINCRFVPSPGATSSLAIARMVQDKIRHVFEK